MRRLLPILLSAALLSSFPVCGAAGEAYDPTDDVLATFAEIAGVPRPSGHEELVSEYLEGWAEERGFAVYQDDLWNLVIDVPATEGMEQKPLVALQCHMDMVFAQVAGGNLDPLSTRIQIVNDGTYLTSDGTTSLGADDGIGLAIAMNVAEGLMAHGPLRLIITTNEEDGMTGTFGLDPKYLADVPYLINLDAEDEGSICLSTAACVAESFDMTSVGVEPTLPAALRIDLRGLRGGHSGIEIDKGRLSAIQAIAAMLVALDGAGIEYELASISGGTAPNAIPSMASAIICVSGRDAEYARRVLLDRGTGLRSRYMGTDPGMTVSVESCENPALVMSRGCRDVVLDYIGGVTDGVVTMSQEIDGLVESSSNLGLIRADASVFSAVAIVRSSSPDRLAEILARDERLSRGLGIAYAAEKSADPWPYNPHSHLAEVADQAYLELFHVELGHLTVHAGLECGTFYVYNPGLDMIALGPTLHDVHTVNETLEIASVAKVWYLIQKTLANI